MLLCEPVSKIALFNWYRYEHSDPKSDIAFYMYTVPKHHFNVVVPGYVDASLAETLTPYVQMDNAYSGLLVVNLKQLLNTLLVEFRLTVQKCGQKPMNVTDMTVMYTNSVCRHVFISGQGKYRFTWTITVHHKHMINLTINKADTQHSRECSLDMIIVTYGQYHTKFCGRVFYESVYTRHNQANINAMMEYSLHWHIDIQYEMCAAGIAHKFDKPHILVNGIKFSYTPSIIQFERYKILIIWYFNLLLYFSSFQQPAATEILDKRIPVDSPIVILKNKKNALVVTEFACENQTAWFMIQSGLVPIVLLKAARSTLTCNDSTPKSYPIHNYKLMTISVLKWHFAYLQIKLSFLKVGFKNISGADIIKNTDIKQISPHIQYFQTNGIQMTTYSYPMKLYRGDEIKTNYVHFHFDKIHYVGPPFHMDRSLIQDLKFASQNGHAELKGNFIQGTMLFTCHILHNC